MPEKNHPMRPYQGALRTVKNPLGKKFEIKPRGSKECVKGKCVDVIETQNQRHFFIEEDGILHQFGEGTMVVYMSRSSA